MDLSNPGDNERGRRFTRRAFVMGGLQCGILSLLGGRLAWLQIAEGQRYRTLAEKNRISLRILAPSRGQIVDRFGVPLAVNVQNFRALLVPEQAGDVEKALRAFQNIVSVDDRDVHRLMKQVGRSPSFAPVEIRDNLTWPEVARVEVNLTDLPGISVEAGELRSYPFGEATAHLIGYVGAVAKNEQSEDPLTRLPGFRIGKNGIEKKWDAKLRGAAGRAEVEVNVLGREVRELRRFPARVGERTVLTIDAELQRLLYQRLAQERSASAVVLDAHTGAIYAMASFPAFDPNVFSRGIPSDLWEEIRAAPVTPLTNKAVAGQYPPGSTFKMVTALAGLEAGIIGKHTSVFCPGHYEFGRGRFHCWKKEGHGTVNVVRALSESCDVFFYRISTEIGIDRIATMARRLGLGAKFEFELVEQMPGLVPDVAWKKTRMGQPWHPGETVVASIGQGYMLATPLQLAVMTARLVNGGRAVEPSLTAGIGDGDFAPRGKWPDLEIDPAHLEIVGQGMYQVVNGSGTAARSRIAEAGMEMGGKTGTSQVRRITAAERAAGVKNETLPWKHRHHALFVGYAPVAAPRYACAVVVEHGSSGSGSAAPLARDLMLMTQQRDPASKPIWNPIVTADSGGGRR